VIVAAIRGDAVTVTVLEVRATTGELDVAGSIRSVEVLGSGVATTEGGGDIEVACTKVTNAVSVPRAGSGGLDLMWIEDGPAVG
jgi:hypothetical protein